MAFPIIAAAAAGAGLLGGILNNSSQRKTNDRAERFSREMYNKQRADALSDWHMQNAYNDPAAQMARLKDGGLNPNLVYGNGAAAQTAQSPPRGSTASTPTFQAPKLDAGSIAFNALNAQQLQANIARTQAETDRIKADTQSMLYNNQFLTPQMFEEEYSHRLGKSTFGLVGEEAKASIAKLQSETQALIAGYDRNYSPLTTTTAHDAPKNSNLSVAKLQADIKNIVDNNTGINLSNALKAYEKQIIDSLSVSGSHAGTIVSNILKLILLSKN